MPYEPPLQIRERWTRFELVDAKGRVVAVSPTVMPWNGAAEQNNPKLIRANFERMAAVLNAAALVTAPQLTT